MTNEEIRKAIELGKKLEKECTHSELFHRIVGDDSPDEGSVKCNICGKELGWWCPVSENRQCQYFGHHKEKQNMWLPYWDEDDCIYCHQPEERK